MRVWARSLLQCVRCGRRGLEVLPSACVCPECGTRFPIEGGVADFLDQPHPSVRREIDAVASLDSRDPEQRRRVRELLAALDRDEVAPEDPRLSEFPSFREYFAEARQMRRLLETIDPAAGSLVVDLGADHCLHSGVLLDHGCRVVAVDITDHLRLAPRAESPELCRVRADMNRLPLADSSVDLVWANACVHHSWSLETTFREARRVLARGCFVLVNEPMPAWPRYLLFGLGAGFGRQQRKLGINETLHRRSSWLATARRAGFEPRLVLPELTGEELAAKLARRGLPAMLAPLLSRLAGPLQVSVHMVAQPR